MLTTTLRSQRFGDLFIAKQPDVQTNSKVLQGTRYVAEGMADPCAGGLVVEQSLPRALELLSDFQT